MKRMHMLMALVVGVFAAQAWADLASTNNVRGDGKTLVTFTAGSGTWTIPEGVTNLEVLVVGGGGSGAAGGTWNADGGGAGGLAYYSSYGVTGGGSVSITVGAGGAALAAYGNGNNGVQSTFDALTAPGGEGGLQTRGGNAGSVNSNGVITAGGLGATHAGSNGGGGAGQNGSGNYGACPGGNGLQFNITGTNTYYAGGGGGGYQGAGGLGGGGRGNYLNGNSGPGENGVDGLGGGGGASRDNANSGAGGSGIVIVAYDSGATMWTVTFDSNGGSPVSSKTVADGKAATEPAAPTMTGYTFVQWCPDSALTNAFNFSTAITSNTTLYAKWVLDWVVSFESNGGSAVTNQYVVPDGNATLPTPAPTKAGHTLVEWCSDSGLTTPFSFSTAITNDTTLYASWTNNSYTLTYSAGSNGSITGTTPQTVEYLGSGTAVSAVPDSGYRFLKWSDSSTDNPRTDANVSGNITVTASFELIPPPITPTTTTTRSDGKTVATFSTVGSGIWTIPSGVTEVEVLVVGGGGGGAAGGTWEADGGGAGGLAYYSSYGVTGGGPVSISVGSGGAARSSYGAGNNGGPSTFDALTASGGEGGLQTRGGNAGSVNSNGVITAGGLGATHAGSNGGGGAGQNGSGAHGDSPGGNGLQYSITGTRTYYGGGGGGGYSGGINVGGLGGGGKGATDGAPDGRGHDGTNGLGGGGGASRDYVISGGGGSGVVIVAYKTPKGTLILLY